MNEEERTKKEQGTPTSWADVAVIAITCISFLGFIYLMVGAVK